MGAQHKRTSWPLIAILMAMALLASCVRPPSMSLVGGTRSSGSALQGHVDFGPVFSTAGYRRAPFTTQAVLGHPWPSQHFAFMTQATMSDVADNATVTLLDQATGRSIATTLTDANGNFSLSLPNFTPATNSYYLEAYKGLSNNAAASSSIRVRTLVQFVSGGWASMTNAPGTSGISIDVGTTALSIITSLRQATTNPVNVAYVNGVSDELATINASNPSVLVNPGAATPTTTLNVSASEFSSVYNLVDQAFAGNVDPVADIVYNVSSGTYALNQSATVPLPLVSSLSVTSGTVGTTVTVSGQNFDTTAANDKVFFPGALGSQGAAKPPVQATVTSASATSLTFTVPSGAYSGPVSIQVDDIMTVAPSPFSVLPTISGFSPTAAITGTSVTISGSAFDANASNDEVFFTNQAGGLTATASITAASYNGLTVTVPSQAVSGAIEVVTLSGSVTSATSFAVVPQVSQFSAAAGSPGTSVTLTGTGFGATQGTSTVTFNGTAYTPTVWNDTTITVPTPTTLGSYPLEVTVGGNTSNTETYYVWNWSYGGKPVFDASANMYFGESGTSVYKATTAGVISTLTSSANSVKGLAIGPDGYLWLADGGYVSKVNLSTGAYSALFTGQSCATGIAFRPDGRFYVGDYCLGTVNEYDIGTMRKIASYSFSGGPQSVVCDASGNGYVQTYSPATIYQLTPSGATFSVSVLRNSGLMGSGSGLMLDPANNLYSLEGNTLVKAPLATPNSTSSLTTGLQTNTWNNLTYTGSYAYANSTKWVSGVSHTVIATVNPSSGATASYVDTNSYGTAYY